MTTRYALYYAPAADAPLWSLASHWLGRDARNNQTLAQPSLARVNARDLNRFTSTPRHYGFHATLKPPMRLAAGISEEQLMSAVAEQASQVQAFDLPGLECKIMGNFLALRLTEECYAMNALAQRLVVELDELRAPATELEKQKRLAKPLTARQLANFHSYGYPYVLDDFRFHLTLSSSLPELYLHDLMADAQDYFAEALKRPQRVEQVALYQQQDSEQDTPFVLVKEFALAGV